MRRRKIAWTIVALAVAAAAAAVGVRMHHWRPRTLTIQGAVIRRDSDTRKEFPISAVDVVATDGITSASTTSDATGYFKIIFPEAVVPARTLDLSFEHPDYEPLGLKFPTGLRLASNGLYIAAMVPDPQVPATGADAQTSLVSNIRVRYSVNVQSVENIGSAIKTFQVVNKGNVPCNGLAPCSPDGNWKASAGSISLDAGTGSEFRNARASCIAGPCPFTRIDSSGYVNGGRNITVPALVWSDTATFLLEAEVFRTAISSRVRELYPVVFGQALHFTLPPTQEGVSIEADVNEVPMVFPLGRELYMSWATCSVRHNNDAEMTTVYRCELKPGYRF